MAFIIEFFNISLTCYQQNLSGLDWKNGKWNIQILSRMAVEENPSIKSIATTSPPFAFTMS